MQKSVLNSMAAFFICLLAGCQAGHMQPHGEALHPYPYVSRNQSLAQSVQETLSKTGDPELAKVHVDMNQNIIILSGYVKKIRQSDNAEQIAHQISGANVQNNIVVRP